MERSVERSPLNRSEVFFISGTGFSEHFFPKQAVRVRPVRYIRVWTRDEIFANPYTGETLNKATDLPLMRFTFRDGRDRELLVGIPAWSFYFGNSSGTLRNKLLMKPLNDLLIDPQRCSFTLTIAGKVVTAVEFEYAPLL